MRTDSRNQQNRRSGGNSKERWSKSVVDAGLVPAICFESAEDAETIRADVNSAVTSDELRGVVEEYGEDLFSHLTPYPGNPKKNHDNPEKDEEGKVFFVAFDAKAQKALAVIEIVLRNRNEQYAAARQYRHLVYYSIALPWNQVTGEVEVAADGKSASITVFSQRAGNYPFVYMFDREKDRRTFRTPTVNEYRITLNNEGGVKVLERPWKCYPSDSSQSFLTGLKWVRVEKDGRLIENTLDEKGLFKRLEKLAQFVGFVKAMIRKLEDELGIERDESGALQQFASAGGGSLAVKLRLAGVLGSLPGKVEAACDADGTIDGESDESDEQ